jgi:hypothetical protein
VVDKKKTRRQAPRRLKPFREHRLHRGDCAPFIAAPHRDEWDRMNPGRPSYPKQPTALGAPFIAAPYRDEWDRTNPDNTFRLRHPTIEAGLQKGSCISARFQSCRKHNKIDQGFSPCAASVADGGSPGSPGTGLRRWGGRTGAFNLRKTH